MGWLHGLCLLPRIGALTPVGLTLLIGGGLGALGRSTPCLAGWDGTHAAKGQSAPSPLWTSAPWRSGWPGLSHYWLPPGAVRLLRLCRARQPHPYTLVDVSADCRTLTLAVRALGDHTAGCTATSRWGMR